MTCRGMSFKIRAGLYTKEKGTFLLYKEPIMPRHHKKIVWKWVLRFLFLNIWILKIDIFELIKNKQKKNAHKLSWKYAIS